MNKPRNAATRQFILAGHATFTVNNDKGQHYTYLVRKREGTEIFPETFFVACLSGGYRYLGVLAPNDGRLVHAAYKSPLPPTHEAVTVLRWALRLVWREAWHKLPEGYGIVHEGHCGKCGRKLTRPDSIDNGIGPECMARMA